MTWALRHDYRFTDELGREHSGTIWHKGYMLGFPLGTARQEDALTFGTYGMADTYARAKLLRRRYTPEKLP